MGRVSVHRSRRPLHRFGSRAAALALALGAAGCAVGVGGGDNTFGSRTGTFVDSTVEGLEFNAGGLIGTTDENGHFFYDPGTQVFFFLGDIQIGGGLGTPVMTPVSLVEGAVDESNPTATNIARFLMTIDDDRDPDNGIQISDAVREAARGLSINFTIPPSTFAGNNGAALGTLSAATTAGGITVSEAAAQEHLRKTLLGLLAGTYGGAFEGDDAGEWEMTIDPDGNVTASSTSNRRSASFDMTGSVHSSGEGLNFSVTGGPKFEGTIAQDGTVSGSWQIVLPTSTIGQADISQFGTFTGNRIE